MSSVDERIVNMKIDNKQLLGGVKSTQSALQSLNKSVDQAGGTSNGLSKAANGVSKLGAGVETVKQKFSLLNAVAVTAVATITNKLVNSGINMVKSLTLGPIMDGYHEYTTNLKAIQTIVANTGAKVPVVNRYLSELNRYSDQTIYNFSEMAKNIGTFTAAGVGLKDATSSIKGIANVAALSGSSSQQAAGAMYQLSQAIAAGKVGAQDWNSVVNAGMAGHQLQAALARTAVAMGDLNKAQVKGLETGKAVMIDNASFKTSIMSLPGHTSWLTSGVLVKSLAALDGRFSKAALSQEKLADGTLKYKNAEQVATQIRKNRIAMEKEGVKYSDKEFQAMMKMSDASFKSAQTIKDAGQLFDVVKESIGSGWSAIFMNVFGNISQASKLWTNVGTMITNTISSIFYKINSVLAVWNKLGGYKAFWQGIGNIFKVLGNLISPFVSAFTGMLGPSKSMGKTLVDLSKKFRDFTDGLVKATSGGGNLAPIFALVGSVLKILFSVLGGVIHYFTALIPLFSGVLGGVTSLVGSVGDLINQFLLWADLGPKISGFFDHIIAGRQKVLGPILDTIGAIIAAFGLLINGDVSGFTNQFKDALTNLGPLGDMITGIVDKAQAGFASIAAKSNGVVGTIAGYLATAAGKVKEFANTVRGMFETFTGGSAGAAVGSTQKLTGATDSLSSGGSKLVGVLKAIGSWIKTAASAVASGISQVWSSMGDFMSGVDKMDLMTTLSLIFDGAVLLSVRKFIKDFQGYMNTWSGIGEKAGGSFEQLTGTLKTMQSSVKYKVILEIAIAVGILTASLWVLSKIPAKQLAVGLGAIAAMIGLLVGSMLLLSKTGGGLSLPVVASSLILMSTALVVLAGAVALFGSMDWKTMMKGFAGIAIGLALLVAASLGLAFAGPAIVLGAAAMVILSVALSALVGTILLYNKIPWGTFLDGMAKMGLLMLAVGVSGAVLASVAPGLLVASVAIGILSVSLTMMLGTILAFSKISWGTFGKGLAMIAIALVAIGVAALIAAPGVILLGAGVLLLGAGLLAAGVGMTMFAAGLAVLVGLGAAAFTLIMTEIQVFLSMLPLIAVQVGVAMMAFLRVLAENAPKAGAYIVVIATSMIAAAEKILPKLIPLISHVIAGFLTVIRQNAPGLGKTMQALLDMALGVMQHNIPKLTTAGVSLVIAIIHGAATRVPQIATEAVNLIVKFIGAISSGLGRIVTAGVSLIIKFIEGIGKNAAKLATAAAKAILDFLHGINAAINTYEPQIIQAGADIGVSIAKGVIKGLGDMVGDVAGAAAGLGKSALGALHGIIKNPPFPSREGIKLGYSLAYGFTTGITSGHKGAENSAGSLAKKSVKSAKDALLTSTTNMFHSMGLDAGSSWIAGLLDSMKGIQKAGQTMAQNTSDTISKTATQLQLKADAQAAKAQAYRDAAAVVRAKARNKKLSKAQRKALEGEANRLSNQAQAIQNQAKATQGGINAAAANAAWHSKFNAADEQGKADMLNEKAQNAAAAAEKDRKLAIQLAEEADLIRKKDAKKAAALDKQARAAMAAAEAAAKSAQQNATSAQIHAANAALNSAADVRAQIDADRATVAEEAKLAAMTDSEKQAYYKDKADKAKADSESKYAQAEQLLKQAEAEAATNAKKAARDVATAKALVEQAEQAAQDAEAAAQQADQLGSSTPGVNTTSADISNALTMPDINIASSKVFDAQNMFDAYAKALAATSSAAAADKAPSITFEQTISSPVALSPSEVYRQSKNLLSNAERKLTSALP